MGGGVGSVGFTRPLLITLLAIGVRGYTMCDGRRGWIGSAGEAFVSGQGISKIVYFRESGNYGNTVELCVGTPANWVNNTFEGVECSEEFTKKGLPTDMSGNAGLAVVLTSPKGPLAYVIAEEGEDRVTTICKFELDRVGSAPDCLGLDTLDFLGPLTLSEDGLHFAAGGWWNIVMGKTDFANPGLKTLHYKGETSEGFLKFASGRVWWNDALSPQPPPRSPLCSVDYGKAVNETRDGIKCGSATFATPFTQFWFLEAAGGSFLVPSAYGTDFNKCTSTVPCTSICAYEPSTEKKYCTDKDHLILGYKLSSDGKSVLLALAGQLCVIAYSDLLNGVPKYTNCVQANLGNPYVGSHTFKNYLGWGGGTVAYFGFPTSESGQFPQLCVAPEAELSKAVCHTLSTMVLPLVLGFQVDPLGLRVSWYRGEMGSTGTICSATAKELLAGADPAKVGVCVC